MTSMIFYEKDHAEKLLKTGLTSFMNYQDLCILAKYFKYIGKNKAQVKKSLLEFCEKFIPDFNEVLSRKKIDDAIKISNRYKLRFPMDIIITKSEIDSIKSYGDYKRQKILFVMLVVSKYFKYNDTRLAPRKSGKHDNDFYVNDTLINILKISKVNVSRVERKDILYGLEQSRLITTIYHGKRNKNKKNSISFKVNFVCEDSDPLITVTDMNNIVNFYPFYCEKCGRIIKNKSKMHNLCNKCYYTRRKELDKKRYLKYNKKR